MDTGINGNVFTGDYFNFNADFLAGKLHKMLIGTQLDEITTKTLIIRPKPTKKNSA